MVLCKLRMPWTEKDTPTPFDTQPIAGLLFLDGDLLPQPHAQELFRQWAESFQGLKYPVIRFPSGTEASVISAGDETLVCIHRQLRLPYFDNREGAYRRASALAEDEQVVERAGETDIILRLDDANQRVVVTYDNEAGRMVDVTLWEPPTREREEITEDLLDRFRALSSDQQAATGLALVTAILDGPWGTWFQNALTARFTVGKNTLVPPYMRHVNREALRRAHLTEDEIDRLSDTDMTTITKLVYEHFITDAYWEELEFITDLVLAGKKRSEGGYPF